MPTFAVIQESCAALAAAAPLCNMPTEAADANATLDAVVPVAPLGVETRSLSGIFQWTGGGGDGGDGGGGGAGGGGEQMVQHFPSGPYHVLMLVVLLVLTL